MAIPPEEATVLTRWEDRATIPWEARRGTEIGGTPMFRQKDRQSLIACITSVLELDRPVHAVAEDRRGGERWSFDCSRAVEQWKVTRAGSKGYVIGHNTGAEWSFY